MGKLLQVRVIAWTVSESDVEKAFPSLWKLVWQDPQVIQKKGVLELTGAVFDAVRVGLIDADKAAALKDGAEKAEGIRLDIEKRLGEWKPGEADKLIYQLEDLLESLEEIASQF
ncbi:hypothetical protein GO013_04790 [Pseudodesulfovibrio sp. JC047]|uniref:hypothetical protein n=1 Tax=Pseudodesulfovibrio sp. JC047 TaxID=2683199 RepID=UPI0013D267B7|nr:hypothetical protein [Pseudodesulfovibrio sp. JC047]NDV18736.1 hypothetical protein [Pseudodesulfovibrio sp. JC047]